MCVIIIRQDTYVFICIVFMFYVFVFVFNVFVFMFLFNVLNVCVYVLACVPMGVGEHTRDLKGGASIARPLKPL